MGVGNLLALAWLAWVMRDGRVRWRLATWGATTLATGYAFRDYVGLVRRALAEPREWDFLCFWTWGRMAVTGGNPFLPSSDPAYAIGRSTDFQHEILGVGMWYPPPSLLLFSPLGLLSPGHAQAAWFLLQGTALAGAAFVAWRLLSSKPGAVGLVATFGFLVAMPAMRSTFAYSQTHALGLLLSLLVLRDIDRPRAGAWVAFALVVKPFFGFWLVALALLRNWRAIGVAAVGLLALALATLTLFGVAPFATFLLDGPSSRVPSSVFVESANQSLSAMLFRGFHLDPLAEPWRALAGVASLAVAAALHPVAVRAREQSKRLGVAVVLLGALLVYPGTLTHYAALLPLAWLPLLRDPRPIVLAGVVLSAWAARLGDVVFWLNCATLAWVTVTALGSGERARAPEETVTG